ATSPAQRPRFRRRPQRRPASSRMQSADTPPASGPRPALPCSVSESPNDLPVRGVSSILQADHPPRLVLDLAGQLAAGSVDVIAACFTCGRDDTCAHENIGEAANAIR